MRLKIGPFRLVVGKKSWSQLETMIRREKGGIVENLKTNSANQITNYRSWVYSCVSLISDRVSCLPFSFYNKITGEELSKTNKGYKNFSKPFYHPNDLMTFRFIKSFCQIQLDLCGMAVLFKGINKLGQVWELWPLNMNDFIKVEASENSVKYFFRSASGGFIDYDINELIVINYSHPQDPWIGMSPIQAHGYAIDIDQYVEVYERDFFKNSARIDMALTTDQVISQEKADELKSRWMEKHNGRFHDMAVLDSGLKVVPMNFTNKDFEFIALAGWSKEKILSAFRVPANKLGSTESNRAGSVYTDISFNRESIQPRLTIWDEELTQGVLASFDPKVEIRHQNPIPRDRQLEVQESKAYLGGLPSYSINEVREKQNLKPQKNGERILLKTNTGYIFLDELDQIPLEQRAGIAINQPDDNSDRDRSDEEPHTNPDGTDDRDDNPTDGRSFTPDSKKTLKSFHFFVNKSRETWNSVIFDELKNIPKNDFENHLKSVLTQCIKATVESIFAYYGEKEIDIDLDDWINPIASKSSSEYTKTLFFNPKCDDGNSEEYFKSQFDSNVRLSKIINALLRSSVNYSKWLLISRKDLEIEWIVNNNECGHRGRLDSLKTLDCFKVGYTKIRFPGETLSFDCDCTITISEQ